MSLDINMKRNERGDFDFSVVNGDFEHDNGIDTSIPLSLLTDSRASESEVSDPINRRGWVGNLNNDDSEFNLGSKIWLTKKSRLIQDTINRQIDYSEQCLQWQVNNKISKRITVTGSRAGDGTNLFISILRPNGSQDKAIVKLWRNSDFDFNVGD